ncbi:MAG: hypothetical protein M1838_000780 [Thelocarpon superellum]|nr:MAG: hypothetical protein M1838_000780 [Thelocarpon superellum]
MATISTLVRGKGRADVLASRGVTPVLFNSLDETDVIEQVATQYDVIINTASGFHDASARAMTSGTSNLADQPVTGKYHETRIFYDRDDIYSYKKSREALQPYAQRTTNVVVIEEGSRASVKTYVLMSPTIYGLDSGLFNVQSTQVPTLIRVAIQESQAEVIGAGGATWDHVHIADVSRLYELVLSKILRGEAIPHGTHGWYFSEAGRHTWLEMSQGVADALYAKGEIKSKDVRSIELQGAVFKWAGGSLLFCELGYASNSRTQGDLSRNLGWLPEKTDEDFRNHYRAEVRAIVKDLARNYA